MTDYIVLIDPALKDNSGTVSDNLGDCIISDSVTSILRNIFPNVEIIKVSAHQNFQSREKNIIKNSLFSFVGGSNILTSQVRFFERLVPQKKKGFYLYPGINKLILVGAGWNNYDKTPDWATTIFYQRILNRKKLHSLRDSYSIKQLRSVFIKNTLMTSCPTTWSLDTSKENAFNLGLDAILFTFTDYNQDEVLDEKLIKLIFNTSMKDIYFFCQGKNDLNYLQSLKVYKRNKSKIKLIGHRYQDFQNFIKYEKSNYIGTRLHAGIACLNSSLPTLIIGIDNRAWEIRKDIHLPVIKRNDLGTACKWVQGNCQFDKIQLPLNNIERWKNQFKI